MNTIPLVRASVILPFVNFLNQIGAPTERLLQTAHIPICILDNPESLAPLNQAFAFAELAARSQGIENLGLLVGQRTYLSQLGKFGAVVSHSLTLHDLIGKIIQLHNTLLTGEKIWFTEDGDHLWLHHQYTVPRHIPTYQGQCFSMLVYANVIHLGADPGWQPDHLHLQCSKHSALLELDCLSKTVVRFNQPTNALRFPKAFLSQPLSPSIRPSIGDNTEAALKLTAPATNFADALRQLIRLLLPEGYPNLAIAAEASGVSIRTFQRRLAEADLTYSQLVEQVRFEQAIHLLQNPAHQLIDIALELGFTDPANFSRAFKRWTGVAPRQFRDLHCQRKRHCSTLIQSSPL
ncbi:MAG TPA: helix-turn-helix domain-containing protein [Microcoleaceae cyanobacterium]|jgi:AraC-like DNA-binding protein